MTNDKKLMLLAGVLALGMLAGCSSASAASAASGMAGSMPAASEVEEVSSEVRVLPGEEGVMMPIDQGKRRNFFEKAIQFITPAGNCRQP